ncbi:MAG: alpha/beta fold hydrolase [Kofleriaceae bacterium]
MARLHHERIAHSEASPAKWLALTHGIYGAGSNWRGIARKIVSVRRDWGVVLVDLRAHGKSETGEPPHTIDACAADVCTLVESLRVDGVDVRALAGHSFGGKVMLGARERVEVAQTWLLDSNPGARPGAIDDEHDSVVRVLHMLERLPKVWVTREAFVGAVVREFDQGLAQWLAMNLVPREPNQFVNRLEPTVLRELLASYFATDAWGWMATDRGFVHIVIATLSQVWQANDRTRLAVAGAHVQGHDVHAGHWLHIDAPQAVVDLVATTLP